MRVTRIDLDSGTVHVIGAVHGLVSEAERVRAAFADARPRVVALGVSAEGVAGLIDFIRRRSEPGSSAGASAPAMDEAARRPEPRRHADGTYYEEDVVDPYDYEASDLLTDNEVVYGLALERFGKVALPPPDLVAAVEVAHDADVPLFGVDFSEERYGDVFAENVGTFALMRYTRAVRRLARRPPEAASPREFAVAWDAALRRIRGYDAVERAREAQMAGAARHLASEHGVVLLVVDAAREDGVLAALAAK